MKIKKLVVSQSKKIIADIGNGRYVARGSTMELDVRRRVKEGFKVERVLISGWMMRCDEDFVEAVEALTEKEVSF